MANQHRPVTDEDRRRVKELHTQGLGRNAIAKQIGRGTRTVSEIAASFDPPLTFDRTATAAATEAKKIDAKARRADIIAELYDLIDDELAYLREGPYELTEVSLGKPVRYTVDRLPAQDRKALVSSISSSITAVAKLEALDTDDGVDAAKGMVGQLLTGLGAICQQQKTEGAGDAP